MCSKCGLCCRALGIRQPKRELWSLARQGDANGSFTARHWHRISRAEALRRNSGMAYRIQTARAAALPLYFYECDAFDPATNLCTAHADRPPVCRGFPWYGRAPEAASLRPFKECSFWEDVRERQLGLLAQHLAALASRRALSERLTRLRARRSARAAHDGVAVRD
jgi:Fe-S-cluster containining protein